MNGIFNKQIQQQHFEIRIYPDSILREHALPVVVFDKALMRFTHTIIRCMRRYKGIGLAAPQIGALYRIVAIEVENKPRVLINPEIVLFSYDTDSKMEGCLSLPDTCYTVERYFQIEVKAKSSDGQDIFLKAEGLPARIIQHEVDHLNGILICDKENAVSDMGRQ